MAWTHVFAAGLVSMGSQWAVIDLPYPDVPESASASGNGAAPVERQVELAICRYAHQHSAQGPRPDVSQLRIDGARATALLTTGNRVEWVHLEQAGTEWRVVQTFAHR
jgi:hypothetical protein